MSILVIWSSPNTDGLTAAAADHIVQGIHAAGAEADVIHLNAKNVSMCRACGNSWGTCLSQGKCVIDDDFEEIYRAIIDCDALVLISPVYWHDISENMKALVDRMRRCDPFTNHALVGKKCMLVACAGGTGNGAISCLRKMEAFASHLKMQPLERIPVIRFNREYMLPALRGAGEMFARHHEDWK